MMTLILATFLTVPAQTSPVAQFRPCVWLNTCSSVAAPVVAQVQTCVWPNKCATSAIVPVEAAVPVTTCVWPNVCG